MLILFDIDATLLLTDGAGLKAMHAAGQELFGEHFSMNGIEFSGRLDTLIYADLVRLNGIDDGHQHHDRFRETYRLHLERQFREQSTARLLPGVESLVQRLARIDHVTLGLLTGNYPETGRMKIQAAGLDPDLFPIAAWGCEGSCRRDLPPVALSRYAQRFGRPLPPEHTLIIGDTPHDIDCAKAHGCRSLGVATGSFSVDELRDCGADLAVENLAATDDILAWMLHVTPPVAK